MNNSIEIENLLPLVAELADRYTSRESSSVTYETAAALMEAVLYCLRECEQEEAALVASGPASDVRALYRRGAQLVIEKTHTVKALYDTIIQDFEDYGCMNYRDTILKGMPQFFLRYDPVFAPGNHLLTLDYPLLCGKPQRMGVSLPFGDLIPHGNSSPNGNPFPHDNPFPHSTPSAFKSHPLCGIDLILEYLKGIRTEQLFLNQFHPDMVRQLLYRVSPDYKKLYLDNICDPVLLYVTGCVLSAFPDIQTVPSQPQLDKICTLLKDRCPDETVAVVASAIHTALNHVFAIHPTTDIGPETISYFIQASPGISSRIRNGITHNCLDTVFYPNMAVWGPMDHA